MQSRSHIGHACFKLLLNIPKLRSWDPHSIKDSGLVHNPAKLNTFNFHTFQWDAESMRHQSA